MVKINQDYINEEFKKDYGKINEFSHILGMLELRDLLVSFRTNERHIFISKNVDYEMYPIVNGFKKM